MDDLSRTREELYRERLTSVLSEQQRDAAASMAQEATKGYFATHAQKESIVAAHATQVFSISMSTIVCVVLLLTIYA